MQYHQGQTTLPRLVSLLQAIGLAISKRQVLRLLTERQDDFIDEARDVLRAGLEGASWISVDDTGARHRPRKATARRSVMTILYQPPEMMTLPSFRAVGLNRFAVVP
jgi:hypothetical protein